MSMSWATCTLTSSYSYIAITSRQTALVVFLEFAAGTKPTPYQDSGYAFNACLLLRQRRDSSFDSDNSSTSSRPARALSLVVSKLTNGKHCRNNVSVITLKQGASWLGEDSQPHDIVSALSYITTIIKWTIFTFQLSIFIIPKIFSKVKLPTKERRW